MGFNCHKINELRMNRRAIFFTGSLLLLIAGIVKAAEPIRNVSGSVFDLPSIDERFGAGESQAFMSVLSPLVQAPSEPNEKNAEDSEVVKPLFHDSWPSAQIDSAAPRQVELKVTSSPERPPLAAPVNTQGEFRAVQNSPRSRAVQSDDSSPFGQQRSLWKSLPAATSGVESQHERHPLPLNTVRQPQQNPHQPAIVPTAGISEGSFSQSASLSQPLGDSLPVTEKQELTVAAQEAKNTATPPQTAAVDAFALTPEMIATRQQQAEAAGLEGDLKTLVTNHFQKAQELLKLAEEARTKTASYQEQIQTAPQLKETLKAQLQQEQAKYQISGELSTVELEQLLTSEAATLADVTKKLDKLEADAKARNDRKPELAGKLEESKKNLAGNEQTLADNTPSADPPAVQLARKTEQEAYSIYLKQLIAQFPVEQSYYTTMSEIFLQQKDLALRQKKYQAAAVEVIEAALAKSRQRDLAEQAAEARKALQEAHPALKDLAERNAELTEKRSTYLQEISVSATSLDEIRKTYDRIHSRFEDAVEKEKRTGLTTSIGLHLRNEKLHLPPEDRYERGQKKSEAEIVRIQSELIELEEDRDRLVDLQTVSEWILSQIEDSGQPVPAEINLEEMTMSLLQDRRKYLNDLIGDLELCLNQQGELSAQQKSLAEEIVAFRSHIDERILWIRSAEILDAGAVQRSVKAAGDLFAFDKWVIVYNRLLETVQSYPLSAAGVGLICLLLVALQGNFRLRILQSGHLAENQLSPPLKSTVWAFLLTGLVSCVWPFILWMMGRQLALASSVEEFSYSLGRALQICGIFFGSIELLRQLCRPKGVAEKHLNWPENTVRGLHRNLVGLIAVGLPLLFCLELAILWKDGQWAESLGRMAFIAGMVWFSWCLHRMLKPNGAIFEDVARRNENETFYQFLQYGYYTAVAAPLFLAGLSIAGYQYTSEQLFIRLELTIWLAIVLIVIYSLLSQSIQQAQVQLTEIRQRLQAKVMQAKRYRKKTVNPQEVEEATDPALESHLLAAQIRKIVLAVGCLLFMAGTWSIWAEVLPALQRINGIELWQTTIAASQTVESEGGAQLISTTKVVPITLGHLLFSIGLIVMTTIASGNLPGLMELAVLRRLPLDKGGRNAITTLTRYAIAVVGGIAAAKTVGIHWSSVQWLVAALTVGLGFGLQEIFANFVSGLIILFERPVRIGDTVTIDGVTGTVSRIQIRATTIRDFDQKEYLVPNKEFVTGRLLNWTLTDQVNRIVINVGVAYGTDTDKARDLMLKVAQRHPRVMTEPAPGTTFEGFGDSSLTLVLRCFLPNLEDRGKVITELHTGINREFMAAGIEIPFPQMDLHIRNSLAQHMSEPASAGESDRPAAAA